MTTASIPAELGCPSGLEPPADGSVIDPAPFVRRANGLARLDLAVFGAKCAGCIRKIEGAMSALPDMQSARLNLSTGRLSLVWTDGAFAPKTATERLDAIGYRAAPFDPEAAEKESDREGRRLLTRPRSRRICDREHHAAFCRRLGGRRRNGRSDAQPDAPCVGASSPFPQPSMRVSRSSPPPSAR